MKIVVTIYKGEKPPPIHALNTAAHSGFPPTKNSSGSRYLSPSYQFFLVQNRIKFVLRNGSGLRMYQMYSFL